LQLESIRLVHVSWTWLSAESDAFTTAFYRRLFDIDPTAARLFAHVDMAAQRNKLEQALTVIVHALDDEDRLLPILASLGKRHTSYGVEPHHFDSVGEALLDAVRETLGDRTNPEIEAAWTEAYALVADGMRRVLVQTWGR
jgi:hemoglobin-like flavoprotein